MRRPLALVALVALIAIGSGGSAQVVYPPPLPMAVQDIVQIATPASGDTILPSSGVTVLLINGSGSIAVLTVNLPANPQDGQRWVVASASAITLLNIGGGTIKGAGTGLSVNGYARFIYSASAAAWFRIG